jgi:hypothetical protein
MMVINTKKANNSQGDSNKKHCGHCGHDGNTEAECFIEPGNPNYRDKGGNKEASNDKNI